MNISAIIPSRNRNTQLVTLINSLAVQQLPSGVSFETIIALDGSPSTPALADAVRRAPFPVQVLELSHTGISEAKNKAIQVANGDLLLFLNDDIEPAPDFVEEHTKAQTKNGFKKAVLGWTGWATPSTPTLMDHLIRRTPMIFFYEDMEDGEAYSYRYAWNLNLSVPRNLFDKAGGFMNELRPCMYEDLELAWRLAKLDCDVIYHPDASAIHEHRYTWESYLRREIMLGLMAPTLWNLNQDCFMDIYKVSLDELATLACQGLTIDKQDDHKIYDFFARNIDQPPHGECSLNELTSLYLTHLPVKRRAFRYGLLKGISDGELNWNDRETTAANALLPEDIFPQRDSSLIRENAQEGPL